MALVLLAMTLVSTVAATAGMAGLAGKLPWNHLLGIRTAFARSSQHAWNVTNHAGGPYIVLLNVAALAMGLAFLPFALAGKVSVGLVVMIAVTQSILIVSGGILGWRIGTSKARALLTDAA